MKKLFCTLLMFAMLLAFAGCKQEADSTVTIYIPDTMSSYNQDGTLLATVNVVFEEGWQTKETFTVTYSGDADLWGEAMPVMTYTGKTVVTENSNVSRTEITYDDNGRQICHIIYFTGENESMDKQETTYTYDEYGRRLSEETKMYLTEASTPFVLTDSYTYVDTAEGSEGTSSSSGAIEKLVYDKNYRCILETTTMDGKESSRTETTYDAVGNVVTQVTYYNGYNVEILSKTSNTYKAVEVSKETADRLPQFVRAK